jgi:hypothetical protein
MAVRTVLPGGRSGLAGLLMIPSLPSRVRPVNRRFLFSDVAPDVGTVHTQKQSAAGFHPQTRTSVTAVTPMVSNHLMA